MKLQNCKDLGRVILWAGLLSGLAWGLAACSTTPKAAHKTPATPKGGAVYSHKDKRGAEARETVKYLGRQVPPMPKGHQSEIGYLLEPEGPGKYAIEVVRVGSKKLVWMGRLLYHDKSGRAHWKIIAVLPPRKVPEGFYFSGGNCQRKGRPDPEIVALYKMEEKQTFTQIRNAWKADPENRHFQEVPPREIQCINDAWNRL